MASANSIFRVINQAFDGLCDEFQTGGFLAYVLPFQHGLLAREQFDEFVNSVRRSRFEMIPEEVSRTCPTGSTWPKVIRQHTEMTIEQFIVPMATAFNEETFIAAAIRRLRADAPVEEVVVHRPWTQAQGHRGMFSLFDSELLQ